MTQNAAVYDNVTEVDLELALTYLPILVALAKRASELSVDQRSVANTCISYGDLLSQAKINYPENVVIQRAIPVSTGRRLDVVRRFTSQKNIPDITCLVINGQNEEVGDRYPGDPAMARELVFAYDWSEVLSEFDMFIKETKIYLEKKPKTKSNKLTKVTPDEVFYNYYRENEKNLVSKEVLRKSRAHIVLAIKGGTSPDEAFAKFKLNTI